MIFLRILAVLAGIFIVVATIGSAIKTVVIPRAQASRITRAVFLIMRYVFRIVAPPSSSYAHRDRWLAAYSPLSLVATLATWLFLVFTGYTLIYLGVEGLGLRAAVDLSGSSLFTLGITRPAGEQAILIVFTEAAIGLFLLALLVTYLPSIYSAFSRREFGVTELEVRAGSPPSGRELIWRFWVLERAHHLNGVWTEWERWFVDVEETHTSLPALVFFRSPSPDHSWVIAAGAVLDGASLVLSSVEIERDVQAEFCIRAGYLCLRRIANYFGIPNDPDPSPEDPISVTRGEWEAAVNSLQQAGVPIKADREAAWRSFAGWRVNYDAVLLALCNLTSAPPAPWSSDRSGDRSWRPRVFSMKVLPPKA